MKDYNAVLDKVSEEHDRAEEEVMTNLLTKMPEVPPLVSSVTAPVVHRQSETANVEPPPWHGPETIPPRVTGRTLVGASSDGDRPSDDFYPTPPEATRALLAVEKFGPRVWEPACGDGSMAKVLIEEGYNVVASDLYDHGYGLLDMDFLGNKALTRHRDIITNPPFKLAQEFAERAIEVADEKVAMLCRLAFLESRKRKLFFEKFPPVKVWVFSWRVPMWRRGVVSGKGGGKMMPYAWFVWEVGHWGRTELGWL